MLRLHCVVDLLKDRIVSLENELKQKDTVIKFLTKKLVEIITNWLVKVLMLIFL